MQKDNDLPARGRSDCRQTPNKTRGLSLFLCIFSINQQKKGRRCSRLGLFDPSLLAFVKEAAFGIGGGLCNGGGIAGRVFRWFEVVFSVCVSIVGNFFFQLLLVAAHVFLHCGFFVFVAIGMGFDVGGIDELEACVDEALIHGLLKDVGEDGLKEVGVFKTSTVILPKGGESKST